MATEVERIFQQKEKEKEQYKAVLKQKDNELGRAKERFQRDFDQSKADHQEHFKRMENNKSMRLQQLMRRKTKEAKEIWSSERKSYQLITQLWKKN